jgi:hydroxyacylglutathione hydrolase
MKVWKTNSGYTISCLLSGRSNVFLLEFNGINILIDTGTGRRWDKLCSRLKKLGVKKIDYLILTHTHYDHAENSAKLKREFGAKVIVNKKEGSFLEKGHSSIPDGTNFVSSLLVKTIAPALAIELNYEPCAPDILVDQYFDLKKLGFNGYILHTPGHSGGSQSVVVDNEIAMVGDTMFGVFPGSVFPPFAEEKEEMIKSWGTLINTKCYLFLPSHGTANTLDLVKKEYLKRKDKHNGNARNGDN